MCVLCDFFSFPHSPPTNSQTNTQTNQQTANKQQIKNLLQVFFLNRSIMRKKKPPDRAFKIATYFIKYIILYIFFIFILKI